MMLLERIWENLRKKGEACAYCCEQERISYRQLCQWTGRLCAYFKRHYHRGNPILVYGHKQPLMAVAFLSCAFGGFPFIPVDSSTPFERLKAIMASARPQTILAVDSISGLAFSKLSKEKLEEICEKGAEIELPYPDRTPDEIFYILYTSGSTGFPKGVMVTCENLDSFVGWMAELFPKPPAVILNQAAFSFDLSVADFWPALAWGSEEYVICRQMQKEYPLLFSTLERSSMELMVATPSFASLLLMDQSFCKNRLPSFNAVFFCGEPLPPGTAQKLLERFPGIRILNAYGPTECTVAVTAAEIGPKEAKLPLLPVGKPKADVKIRIEKNKVPVEDGEPGEIVILGDSVAAGYVLEDPSHAFGRLEGKRSYHTGDIGWMQNGVLYCAGRCDQQVKIQGYRIELQDVEKNLCALPGVDQAVVVCREAADGRALRLIAFVIPKQEDPPTRAEIQALLAHRLPDYMRPSIQLIKNFPLTENGKCDRKRLKEIANGRSDFEIDSGYRK